MGRGFTDLGKREIFFPEKLELSDQNLYSALTVMTFVNSFYRI